MSVNTNPIYTGNLNKVPGLNPVVPNLMAGSRLRDNSIYYTGASGLRTSYYKVEAEAPFSAVRIWVGDKDAASPPTFSSLVAATETGLTDTVANLCTPIYNGTSYNSLSSSFLSAGFRPVTWGGATTITMPASAAPPAMSLAVSDWISCKSIPRTDIVGGRPMFLFRVAQQNSAANFTSGGDTMTGWATPGHSWNRLLSTTNTLTNGVTTITNLPNLPTILCPSYELFAWVEFLYDSPARNVVVIGDSRMSSAYSISGSSWVVEALLGLSSQSAPINITNIAGSGMSPAQTYPNLINMVSQGYSPTDLVIQGFSQNGFQQNHAGAEGYIGGLMKLVNLLRSTGTQIWMTTDYGVDGYVGVAESARQECIAFTRSLAQNGVVSLVDTDPLLTDYSVPGSSPILPQYNQDNVHANPAGQALMSELLASVWR